MGALLCFWCNPRSTFSLDCCLAFKATFQVTKIEQTTASRCSYPRKCNILSRVRILMSPSNRNWIWRWDVVLLSHLSRILTLASASRFGGLPVLFSSEHQSSYLLAVVSFFPYMRQLHTAQPRARTQWWVHLLWEMDYAKKMPPLFNVHLLWYWTVKYICSRTYMSEINHQHGTSQLPS